MLYRLNICLTEQDYLAFNTYHSLQSAYGKKMVQKSRLLIAALMVAMLALIFCILGWNPISWIYAAVVTLVFTAYIVLLKKRIAGKIKWQIRRMKKMDKLPMDAVCTLEFYEDKMVEITPTKRIEQNYNGLQKLCVVKDSHLLLYTSSVNAHIIPLNQVAEQADEKTFLEFLSSKCPI